MNVYEINALFPAILARTGFEDLLTIKHGARALLNCAETDYEHDAVVFALEYILRGNSDYVSDETRAFIDSLPVSINA